MRKLIYLLAFTTSLHAQHIVQLSEFNPYELAGDTLYFNRNGFDIVKTVKSQYKVTKKGKKKIGEQATYYILTNDHTDKIQMRVNTLDLIRGIVSAEEYSTFKCSYNFSGQDKAPISRFEIVTVGGKQCNWIPKPIPDTTKLRFEASYFQYDDNSINLYYLPKEKRMLDSVSTFLDYLENSYYYIDITRDEQTEVKIIPADKCSNYNQLSIANRTVSDLVNFLAAYDWPIFKAHSRIMPYRIFNSFSYQNFVAMKLEQELKNGCANSYKLFDQKDSLYALTDTFNKRTVLYLVGAQNKPVIAYSTNRARIIDFGDQRRVDINNDGFKDIISDSSRSENTTTITYYPNYQTKDKFNHSLYKNDFLEKLRFTYNLGNGYFYYLNSAEDNDYAEIFQLKNNIRKTLIYYRKVYYKSKKRYKARYIVRNNGYETEPGKYVYEWYVGGMRSKTVKTQNPQKAIELKNDAIKRFQNYIDHPEQLITDFN